MSNVNRIKIADFGRWETDTIGIDATRESFETIIKIYHAKFGVIPDASRWVTNGEDQTEHSVKFVMYYVWEQSDQKSHEYASKILEFFGEKEITETTLLDDCCYLLDNRLLENNAVNEVYADEIRDLLLKISQFKEKQS